MEYFRRKQISKLLSLDLKKIFASKQMRRYDLLPEHRHLQFRNHLQFAVLIIKCPRNRNDISKLSRFIKVMFQRIKQLTYFPSKCLFPTFLTPFSSWLPPALPAWLVPWENLPIRFHLPPPLKCLKQTTTYFFNMGGKVRLGQGFWLVNFNSFFLKFGFAQLTSFHYMYSFEAEFYKPNIIKFHPPICKITALG